MTAYYHPSNSGRWSQSLGNFIVMVAGHYVKRIGRESRGTAHYPREFYIDATDMALPHLMRDVAIVAMYSKNGQLANSSAATLARLSYVLPQEIVPLFVAQIQPALTSSGEARRMMAVLGSMDRMLPAILSLEGNPQAGPQLSSLLFLLLDGINAMDPVKMVPTMQAYTTIFLHVPLIDAVQSDKLPAPGASDRKWPESGTKHAADEARGATMVFGEFAYAFTDKILQLLKVQGKPEAQKVRAAGGSITSRIMWYLHSAMTAFFQALSPALATDVAVQVCVCIGIVCGLCVSVCVHGWS
jgi:ferredoxin